MAELAALRAGGACGGSAALSLSSDGGCSDSSAAPLQDGGALTEAASGETAAGATALAKVLSTPSTGLTVVHREFPDLMHQSMQGSWFAKGMSNLLDR